MYEEGGIMKNLLDAKLCKFKEDFNIQNSTEEKSWERFVNYEFLKEHGFHPLTSSYHQKWVDILKKEGLLYSPKEINPGFIYMWNGDDDCYKISSQGDTQESFNKARKWEKDEGESILTPCSIEEALECYKIIE